MELNAAVLGSVALVRAGRGIAVVCSAVVVAGCGGGGSDKKADQPSKTKRADSAKRLTDLENVQVAAANLAIARYCVQALSYKAGQRPNLPSDQVTLRKERTIDRLVELARKKPHATYSQTGEAMPDVLINASSNLQNGECDKASARRLELTAQTLSR